MTKTTPIFIVKPEILIHKDYLLDFIPNKGTREERLNATVRFGYMSILLTLVKGDLQISLYCCCCSRYNILLLSE